MRRLRTERQGISAPTLATMSFGHLGPTRNQYLVLLLLVLVPWSWARLWQKDIGGEQQGQGITGADDGPLGVPRTLLTSALRHANRLGVRPSARSSRTLCCVGFVFFTHRASPDSTGTSK